LSTNSSQNGDMAAVRPGVLVVRIALQDVTLTVAITGISPLYVKADENSLVYRLQKHLSHLFLNTGLVLAKRWRERGGGRDRGERGERERERESEIDV